MAIVDKACDFTAKVSAVDDHIHETMFQHEFGGLESFGQLYFYCFGNRARPCKTDKRPRLGYQAIAQHCITGGNTAGSRIGQDADIKSTGLSVLLVEQSLDTAVVLSDNVCVMSKGQIIHSCLPEQLYSNTEIVTKYLGVSSSISDITT